MFSTPQAAGRYPLSTNHYPLVTGFTLVEMLVVVAIIGILASLITAAAWRAVITARNAAIKVEITKLDLACKAFKEKFGDYPPDFRNYDALTRFLKRAFPNATSFPDEFTTQAKFNAASATYNPASALRYWLGGPAGKGFSANTQNPFDVGLTTPYSSRIAPFYDFDLSRGMRSPTDTILYRYYPPNGTSGAPYVYFRPINGSYGNIPPYTTSNLAPSSGWTPTDTVAWTPPNPYYNTKIAQWLNPKEYQILCAGRDGKYGDTSTSPPSNPGVDYPTGSDYNPYQYDDMSNFTDGTMEQAMP